MLGLSTANVADAVGNRVVAFHPRRLPGPSQPTRTTTVIVDDVWALVGSSTFRRRGLTFDGGTDVVVTDQNLVEGRSPTIAALRRSLQANRLGIAVPAAVASGLVPPPFVIFVRLADGVEAFHEIRETLRGSGNGRIARLTRPTRMAGRRRRRPRTSASSTPTRIPMTSRRPSSCWPSRPVQHSDPALEAHGMADREP
jgi:hypothetical protein